MPISIYSVDSVGSQQGFSWPLPLLELICSCLGHNVFLPGYHISIQFCCRNLECGARHHRNLLLKIDFDLDPKCYRQPMIELEWVVYVRIIEAWENVTIQWFLEIRINQYRWARSRYLLRQKNKNFILSVLFNILISNYDIQTFHSYYKAIIMKDYFDNCFCTWELSKKATSKLTHSVELLVTLFCKYEVPSLGQCCFFLQTKLSGMFFFWLFCYVLGVQE